MKHTKTILVFVLILALLSLAACGKKPADTEATPTLPPTETAPGESGAPSDGQELLKADFAAAELLAKPDSFDEFIEKDFAESEYLVKLSFTAQTPLTDFKFLSITLSDVEKDGEPLFTITDVLYSTAELNTERPLVIGTVFEGDMPTRGISFVDDTGTTRYLSVSSSGLDGSLVCAAFLPAA
jgi:predicted small lipoprotein YifL